ncbi:Response regulator receiver domain-containing protein [Cnuella takakiae]|uniref:Response regulator receiver domain-containing protein n=1 Tax=Cnuella takakiae TaxID=1302690 RepID=A0A1M4Z964_9BACT|nr:response regulator [Cnuella takakiae]SHF14332.1 Response regulator receiver domain-containing protein [Cnuella takakiae]
MAPILILKDDQEDQEIFETAFYKLQIPNRRQYFENGQTFLDFLRGAQEQPFIILSDIRVGVMNGLELRDEIQKDDYLRRKGIPFVFLTTDYRKKVVE